MFCPRCGSQMQQSPLPSNCPNCQLDLAPYAPVASAPQAEVKEVLPSVEQFYQTTPASQPAPTPAANDGKAHILIVEDENDIAQMYAQALRSQGFAVEIASDGSSGEDKLESQHFDLLLLDIMLPGQNGLNILKEMKEDHRLPDMPVIILSNLDQGAVIDRGLALGAVHYLVKANHTPGDLVELVRTTIPLS